MLQQVTKNKIIIYCGSDWRQSYYPVKHSLRDISLQMATTPGSVWDWNGNKTFTRHYFWFWKGTIGCTTFVVNKWKYIQERYGIIILVQYSALPYMYNVVVSQNIRGHIEGSFRTGWMCVASAHALIKSCVSYLSANYFYPLFTKVMPLSVSTLTTQDLCIFIGKKGSKVMNDSYIFRNEMGNLSGKRWRITGLCDTHIRHYMIGHYHTKTMTT